MPDQKKLTKNATLLLGLMTGEAERDGTYSAKREDMAHRLGWSDATHGRTLKELRDRGEISVVKPGGGAGRPTTYRITRLARERVAGSGGPASLAGGSSFPNRDAARASGVEPAHHEGVREGVHGHESAADLPNADFIDLGRDVVDFTAGFVRRAYELWSAQSAAARFLALTPATCWAGWAVVRRTCGRNHGYLGLIIGAELAFLAALAVPSPGLAPGALTASPLPSVGEGGP